MKARFEIRPVLEDVDPLVMRVRKQLEPVLPADRLAAVELAVTEALVNSVQHAHGQGQADPIRLELCTEKGATRITIIDAGTAPPAELFETAKTMDQIDLMAEAGRGLALILHCADEVTFEPEAGLNRLDMVFRNPPGA